MFSTNYLFLDLLLYFILFIKIILLLLLLGKNFIINKKIISKEIYNELITFSRNCFDTLMPILLIILFNPITSKYMILNHHVKLFLFIFGVLQLIHQIEKYENF